MVLALIDMELKSLRSIIYIIGNILQDGHYHLPDKWETRSLFG